VFKAGKNQIESFLIDEKTMPLLRMIAAGP
jgi:hypothetical protein